ncbi:Rox3-domain-containing protein [Amniculicola lignicola CBS 123094]|uniref:Mediator of RNA polymerase II transcription subunit 19 n=1 Tax=Amniculicola lignicola CBS 123094 TaxID=1392246 RepID=A0A6A5WV63_9PLEO|nr:Rox3-domain-containing protein [Amniculicola lignicola CBS 123094]
MSDHSAKRQRLTGSFSPSPGSPLYYLASGTKTSSQTKPIVHPNTPTSPPYMNANPHPNAGFAATAPASEMTPPSSVHMSQNVSQSASSAAHSHMFPTPASTTGLGAPSAYGIDDGDEAMTDAQDVDGSRSTHRQSNHDRQGNAAMHGDRRASGAGLFLLRKRSVAPSRPHVSQNLLQLYGLDDIAKSVARTDPVTGEKINKLRKSYEGHIKSMHIPGKAKATKLDNWLSGLMEVPDEHWAEQNVGKELRHALDDPTDLDTLIKQAMSGIGSGPLTTKEAPGLKAYIGTDELAKPKPLAETAAARPMRPASATPNPYNPPQGARGHRPERQGSKRSYTDDSFKGYSEGYADEDSTAEDNHGLKKRRLNGFERTSHPVEVGGVRR